MQLPTEKLIFKRVLLSDIVEHPAVKPLIRKSILKDELWLHPLQWVQNYIYYRVSSSNRQKFYDFVTTCIIKVSKCKKS